MRYVFLRQRKRQAGVDADRKDGQDKADEDFLAKKKVRAATDDTLTTKTGIPLLLVYSTLYYLCSYTKSIIHTVDLETEYY